jgi:ADP-ribose pyrophosphatase
VPDDKVKWSLTWQGYAPVSYTSSKLLAEKRPVWVDSNDPLEIKNWNKLDGNVDRTSHLGVYDVRDGVPRNPVGRTGITGL